MRKVLHRTSIGLLSLVYLNSIVVTTTSAQAQGGCQVTPGIHELKLPNGDSTFYGRLPMNFPEGNPTEHSVRQIRIHLPLMQNDTKNPQAQLQAPFVQATIELDGQGAGNAMLIYAIERSEESGCATILIDAQTPQGQQSEYAYFINLVVIGTPNVSRKR